MDSATTFEIADHRRRKDSLLRIGEPDLPCVAPTASALLIPAFVRPRVIT